MSTPAWWIRIPVWLRILILILSWSFPVAVVMGWVQPLEKGPPQQFWDIHQYPVKEGATYVGTIHVLKFQVGKNMVCKAMFFHEGYRFEKENNSKDDSIAMAMAMTAASLGDVPCD